MKPFFTSSQLRTLLLLLRRPGVGGDAVADLLWPNSNMHTKSSKSGNNGSRRGKAAQLCGGSYVAKLRMKGWVRVFYGPGYASFRTLSGWSHHCLSGGTAYYLTEVGLEDLKRECLAPCSFCGALSLDTDKLTVDLTLEEHYWNHTAECVWANELREIDQKRNARAKN